MDKKIIEIALKYAEKKGMKYVDKVRRQEAARMIVLYGSHVRDRARILSDIDIAVVVDEASVNYLRTSADLFDLVREIDNRIEPVLVVRNHDKSGFLDNILKHGNIIYKAG